MSGGFGWSDGSPMSYTNYCHNPPDNWNNIQDCLDVGWTKEGLKPPPGGFKIFCSRDTWETQNCNLKLPFVCKK